MGQPIRMFFPREDYFSNFQNFLDAWNYLSRAEASSCLFFFFSFYFIFTFYLSGFLNNKKVCVNIPSYHNTCVKVRKQLPGFCYLQPPCGSKEENSDYLWAFWPRPIINSEIPSKYLPVFTKLGIFTYCEVL